MENKYFLNEFIIGEDEAEIKEDEKKRIPKGYNIFKVKQFAPKDLGSIAKGKRATLIGTKPIPSVAYLL